MRDKDDLDRMIDAALASYGDAAGHESSDPLEDRLLRNVVRRVNSEQRRRVVHWLAWTAVLATAGCIAALLVLHPRQTPNFGIDASGVHSPEVDEPEQPPAIATVRTPHNPQPVAQPKQPGVDRPLKPAPQPQPERKPIKPEPLPKLDVFPAPSSPTDEEATLSFFIQRAPASELQDLLTDRARLDAPVTINQLEIPPIASLNNGGK